MPTNRYTAAPNQTVSPNLPITDVGSREGPRMRFASVDRWVEVQGAGKCRDADPGDPGLFTRGQLICIGVTLIQRTDANWTKARMAHISSSKASLIKDKNSAFYDGWQGVGSDQLWLVVGAKSSIAFDEIIGFVKASLSNLEDAHIWEYAINTSESIGSAVSVQGLFGEPPNA